MDEVGSVRQMNSLVATLCVCFPGSQDKDLVYKDAIFFSMHKFVGGPESPGVLVAKKHMFQNSTPSLCGGGTVFFVSYRKTKFAQ